MKAMIFSAGLGTRLRPITRNIPKALTPLDNKPLIFHIIESLHKQGINEFVVNVHHFADKIEAYLESVDLDVTIHISDERSMLLDTGGGLKNASEYLSDETFLVHNVDVITNLDVSEMLRFHRKNGALATLAVRNRPSGRCFQFNEHYQLVGWKNLKSGEQKIVGPANELYKLPFSGIHIIEPWIFDLIEEEGAFSIIDVYLRLARQYAIYGFRDDDYYWMDVGTPEKLKEAELYLQGLRNSD